MRNTLTLALLIGWMSVPLIAQQQTDHALAALDGAVAAGQTEQAHRTLAELLARPHVDLDVLLETGVKLAEREYYTPAADVFARAVKDYPRSFEAHYNLALAGVALRRFVEAQKALEGLEQLSKEQQLAREYLRGKIYSALDQNELAERSFSAAFRGAPHEENYALDLGLFYLRRQQWAKAVATLESGVKHHPDSVYLTLGLGA